MALGVAIDDTIHYFLRFNSEAKRLADEERATVTVLRSVGRPVIYSTVSLCVGFLMLCVERPALVPAGRRAGRVHARRSRCSSR